jgi:hypothetical protein
MFWKNCAQEPAVFLEQLQCKSLVALRESAVADHVREHNRGEFAMFGAVLRHIAATLCTSLSERSSQGKVSAPTGFLGPMWSAGV